MRKILVFLLFCAGLAAQTVSTDRAVTVTASRNTGVAPDLGLYSLDLLTPTDSTLDDALAALQGSGLTAANFNSVYTTFRSEPSGKTTVSRQYLDWSFTLTVPLGNLKGAAAQLSGLQQAILQKNNGMLLSYAMRGTQTSPQALTGVTCAAADLVSDARAQAQKLAVAAGLSVGSVLAVSGASVVTPPATAFSSGTYQPTCSITVKFALNGI